MKKDFFKTYLKILTILLITALTFSGCELVGDIFRAGIWVGIIIVIIIAAIVLWIIRRFR